MGPSQLDEPTEKTGTGENEEENHEMEEVQYILKRCRVEPG